MKNITIERLKSIKAEGKKFAVITAYDYSFARLIDEAEIEVTLVGDSLGNAICPGAVEGPRMDRVLAIEAEASGKTPQQVRAQYTGGVSLRSFVTGDDIADTVLFLASPAAAKITGQAMTIDGHTESMV